MYIYMNSNSGIMSIPPPPKMNDKACHKHFTMNNSKFRYKTICYLRLIPTSTATMGTAKCSELLHRPEFTKPSAILNVQTNIH